MRVYLKEQLGQAVKQAQDNASHFGTALVFSIPLGFVVGDSWSEKRYRYTVAYRVGKNGIVTAMEGFDPWRNQEPAPSPASTSVTGTD